MKHKYTIQSKLLLIICGVLLIVTGCHNQKPENEIIKFNLDENAELNLKAQIKSIIKLETNENVLIGEVGKIECFDNKIYILDNRLSKSLFVFSDEGKFISKTKIGHGPGEVVWPWAFSIDKQNHKVMLWDQHTSSMITYDMNLNFINSKQHNVLVRDFKKMGEDTFLVMSYKLNAQQDNKNLTTYSVYTDNFEKAIGHYLPVELDVESQSTSNPISQFKQTLFIKPWDNNIYTFDNKNVKVRYSWDLGKYMFKDNEIKDLKNDKKWDKVRDGSRIGVLFNLFESENYLTVATYFRNEVTTLLYSKKSKSAIPLNSLFKNKTLPKCNIQSVIEKDNDTFLGIITDENYGKTTANDNPVLVLFTLTEG